MERGVRFWGFGVLAFWRFGVLGFWGLGHTKEGGCEGVGLADTASLQARVEGDQLQAVIVFE